MTLYLVRHGKSLDDSRGNLQIDQSPLDPKYNFLLKKLREDLVNKISIDKIYSSPYLRSLDTAKYVFAEKNVKVLDYIHEYIRPETLNSASKEEAVKFWEEDFVQQKYDPAWKVDAAESFEDIVKRVKKFYYFLLKKDVGNAAVVGHGTFFRHFIGFSIFKENYTPRIFFNLLLKGIVLNPCGYIKLDFGEKTKILGVRNLG